jgi:pimeloyl-ACP methyl ester carboxylesterase
MKEEKILVDGLKINYKVAGQGFPILILHGWGGSSDSWAKFIEISSQNFKIFCPDLPGFGKSQKPPRVWCNEDYCDFVFKFSEELKIEKFYLIGHSFGGGLAAKFVVKYPEKVKALILCSASIFRKRKRFSLRQLIAYFLAKLHFILAIPFFEKYFYPIARKIVYKIAGVYDYYVIRDGIMKKTFSNVVNEDLSYLLPKIKLPTLIVWGEKDDKVPLEEAFLIQKSIPNSKLEIIKKIGHVPHIKKPFELSKIILDFLKTL